MKDLYFTGNCTNVNSNDIHVTLNHFQCVDYLLNTYNTQLSEDYIKSLHKLLMTNVGKEIPIGEYKVEENGVGNIITTSPNEVCNMMQNLLRAYHHKKNKTIQDIIDFHVQFEKIHPFQDGNGRVGRLIMFKECLKHNITPFILFDTYKYFYYRGLSQWDKEKGYLMDTCLSAQDTYKAYLEYYKIKE